MTLFQRRNSTQQGLKERILHQPYILINIIFAGVIVLILAYSGIFSPDKDNYPVTCIHELVTGEKCASCGLSHSMSLIIRGRFEEASQWNSNGMRVFLFFVLQLVLRGLFSEFYLRTSTSGKRSMLITTDSVVSGLMVVITFWQFIISIFKGLM